MSQLTTIVVVLGVTAALACWVAGVVYYIRALRALSGSGQSSQIWKAMFSWISFSRQATGPAAAHAAKVNKALIAFLACVVIVATAAMLAAGMSQPSR